MLYWDRDRDPAIDSSSIKSVSANVEFDLYAVWKSIGKNVLIDGERGIRGVVTGVAAFEKGAEIRVDWFANGIRQQEWFSPSRLTEEVD